MRRSLSLLAPLLLVACGGAQEGGARPHTPPPDPVSHPAEPAPSPGVAPLALSVCGAPVHALAAGPADARPVVLLLHGARFTSETWRELGTLDVLARAGRRAVALDLPGYGATPASDVPREEWLARAVEALGAPPVVVVSPSMSGAFAFPYLRAEGGAVAGFVGVAPAAIPPSADLAALRMPTLVVWGAEDAVFPLSTGEALARDLPDAELFVMPGAAHPCYLDDPDAFHARLEAFLARVTEGR